MLPRARPQRGRAARDPSMCNDPVVEKFVVDIASGHAHVEPTVALCRLLCATGRGGGGIDLIASLGGPSMHNAQQQFLRLCEGLCGCKLTPIDVGIRLYGETNN
eukprot:8696133-Alexandrium_andersonii.AAC.1